MSKHITNNQLNPDATYLVRGKVGFSRISRQTTDEERQAANKRRMHPVDKNYTSVSLYNAVVLARDPNSPTIEEQYASECLYKSSSPNYPGNNFTAMNKSRNLPKLGVIDPANPGQYTEIPAAGELATGLDVTLVMRVFKGQGNNGVSLDRVLVNEPIRYYASNNNVDQALKDFGITFQPMAPVPAAPAAPSATPVADSNGTAPAVNPVTEPVAQPAPAFAAASASAPAQTAAPAPADNPFSSYNAAPNNVTFGPGTRQY
ncbi:hypothetical protein J6A31_06605 [bacterium]|nr:hypothetical protein [bacterium]